MVGRRGTITSKATNRAKSRATSASPEGSVPVESLKHLIETVTLLQDRGIGFKSLTEQIDITSSGGKLIFHVFGALAEFERDLIRERTNAGLQAARARGRQGGRPRRLDEKKLKTPRALYADKSNSMADILATLNISKSTLYRHVKMDKPL